MALSCKQLEATRSTSASCRPCVFRRSLRPRGYLPSNSVLSPESATSLVAPAVRQQPSQQPRHSVNFKASAADFQLVIARLEASVPEAPGNGIPTPAVSASQPSATAPAWTGLLGNLFGGLRSNSQSQDQPTSKNSSVEEDVAPLSHAVVMFTATWCGPCSMVYRELRLAVSRLESRGSTAVLVIDVEENKDLASELGIKALPTLLYLSPNGERGPIFTQGPVSWSSILDTLDRAVGFGGRNVRAKWLKL